MWKTKHDFCTRIYSNLVFLLDIFYKDLVFLFHIQFLVFLIYSSGVTMHLGYRIRRCFCSHHSLCNYDFLLRKDHELFPQLSTLSL